MFDNLNALNSVDSNKQPKLSARLTAQIGELQTNFN